MKLDLSTLDQFTITGSNPTIIDIPAPKFIKDPNGPAIPRGDDITHQGAMLYYENGWWYEFYNHLTATPPSTEMFTGPGTYARKSQDRINWVDVNNGDSIVDLDWPQYQSTGEEITNQGPSFFGKFGSRYYMFMFTGISTYGGYETSLYMSDNLEGPYHKPSHPSFGYNSYYDIPIPRGVDYDEEDPATPINQKTSQITYVWLDGSTYRALVNATDGTDVFRLCWASASSIMGPWSLNATTYSDGASENYQMLHDSTLGKYYFIHNDWVGGASGTPYSNMWMNSIMIQWSNIGTAQQLDIDQKVLAITPTHGSWDSAVIGLPSTFVILGGRAYLLYDGRTTDNGWPSYPQLYRNEGIASAIWPFEWDHAFSCTRGQQIKSNQTFGDGTLTIRATVPNVVGELGFRDDSGNKYQFEFDGTNKVYYRNNTTLVDSGYYSIDSAVRPGEFQILRDGTDVTFIWMGLEIATITGVATPMYFYADLSGQLQLVDFQTPPAEIPSLTVQPTISNPEVSSLRLLMPGVTIQPYVVVPSLYVVSRSEVTIPSVSCQPTINQITVTAAQLSIIITPNITCQPLITLPETTGVICGTPIRAPDGTIVFVRDPSGNVVNIFEL